MAAKPATRAQRQRVATGKTLAPSSSHGTIPANEQVIVRRLQGRWDYAKQQKDPIIDAGRVDLRYITGHSWDEKDVKARVGRLTLEFDQLNQYLNLLVNSVRQQKRGIQITAEGNGATDKTANLRENRIRQIEYLSNAQEAYVAAFAGAAERSYGYCRIVAEWEPKGFKKRLRIRAIPNPDQVLEDPYAQSITGADWKFLFYGYDMSREEFNRDYPDATFKHYSDLTDQDRISAGDWQQVDRVQVAEYWEVTIEEQTLLRIGTAQQYTDVFEQDLTPAQKLLPVLQEREAERPVVAWYLTNGVELLSKKGKPKRNAWKGSRIPFKACYGKTIYTSNDDATVAGGSAASGMARIQRLSYIRLALNAQKYYNYLKSSEGERFKMNLLVPYIGYEGQFSPEQLELLQQSVHTPVAVVLVKPQTEATGQAVLPLPTREIAMLDTQGYEIAAESARRDIANALGRSSVVDPRRGNARVESGVGLQELNKSADQGSYHFIDAYDAMISAVGEDLEELLPFYDDTADDISTRTASGKVEMKRVNDPNAPDGHLPMDLGTHATTVSTGPSYDSERVEASAFADTLIGNQAIDRILGPQKASQLLALAIKLKNVGPLGDEMAEIVSPQDQNDPKQAQQHLQQAMDQLKKQSAVLDEMHKVIESKQVEAQNKLDIAKESNATDIIKAKNTDDTRIKIAEIQAGAALGVADIKADLQHTQTLMATQLQTIQGLIDSHQAQLDRVQEAQSQLSAQQHEKDLAAQQHTQALAQGDQQQQGALDQQQQAADLAPPPPEGD